MTYKNQFVVEVKADGQILRVKDGSVYLPFGSEYSILLKNLNSKKASVKISIDDQDVLDGNSLIIDPLVTHELKGFFSNTTVKNRFRFIQKTKEIQEHRGDKVGDGLVRVEFAFEKPKPKPYIFKTVIGDVEHHHYHHYDSWWRSPTIYGDAEWDINYSKSNEISDNLSLNNTLKSNVNTLGVTRSFNKPLEDEGITVKGNQINEQYNYGMIGELEPSSVIVISLKGMQQSSGVVVQEPVTIKKKLECSSCGTKSNSSFKFCPNCGTFLE